MVTRQILVLKFQVRALVEQRYQDFFMLKGSIFVSNSKFLQNEAKILMCQGYVFRICTTVVSTAT